MHSVYHVFSDVFDMCLFKSKLVMQILQDMRTITAGTSVKVLEIELHVRTCCSLMFSWNQISDICNDLDDHKYLDT